MKIEDLYIVSHKRTVVSEEEIGALSRHPEFSFPEDVCEFLGQFGPGEFCGCLFLFEPKDLLEGQATLREVYSETSHTAWFDREQSELPPDDILKTTWIARTLDGDEVVYLPKGKTGYYILPRQSDVILKAGNTLAEVLEWFGSSGVMYVPTKVKWFCTSKDRCRLHLTRDEPMSHSEMLKLVEETFDVTKRQVDPEEEQSFVFCREISGYIQIYQDQLDIHHDLDFDDRVCQAAEERFYPEGFRAIEHNRPAG